jgi:Mn2+/Fe2+ NRAMP family transporter
MAAALNLLMPISPRALALGITAAVLTLQLVGSYELIRNIFRWLALTLLAYLGSAHLAHPALVPTLKGTFIPTIHFQRDFMLMLVAVLGTTLSAYLYSWQSNQDVEEDLLAGRTPLRFRFRTTGRELRHSAYDLALGMFFSSLVMYFILLAASATLFATQHPTITTAADAAKALAPLAGKAASALFAVGVIGVGFIAVPIMTTGAAFDLAQSVGWRHGLHKRPSKAKRFYAAIVVFTLAALGLNFCGFNPMRLLVVAGIVQGISTPFLMIVVISITNNKRIVGGWANSAKTNALGWITILVMFAALGGLLLSISL